MKKKKLRDLRVRQIRVLYSAEEFRRVRDGAKAADEEMAVFVRSASLERANKLEEVCDQYETQP